MAYLAIRGPHGRSVHVLAETTVIGRGPTSEIVVHDPMASKRHAEITLSNGHYIVKDLGSTNGTCVSGRRLTDAHTLRDGDEITIGDESLIFTRSRPASRPETAVIPPAPPHGSVSIPVERLGLNITVPDLAPTLLALPSTSSDIGLWMRSLYRLLREANLCHTEDELFSLALHTLEQSLPGANVYILLETGTPDASMLTRWVEPARRTEETPPPAMPAAHGLVEFARERCVAVLSPDVDADPRGEGVSKKSATEKHSLLIAPLLSGRQALGCLCIDRSWAAGNGSALSVAHLEYAAAVAYPLAALLENLRHTQRVMSQNERLRQSVSREYQIVGASKPIKEALSIVERLGPSDASVLIMGESGTGKELFARALHALSSRREGPFEAINCGALAPNLLESELFGHARGAFTGAVNQRSGCFETASGGTLFLDEIAEMPLTAQTRLLRVLQESVVVRVGESRERKVDCRIVAATNRDLDAEVKAGRFREDLYYRLKVVDLVLPPLRKHADDLEPLCSHLLQKFGKYNIHPDAMAILQRYRWPGNIRELRNVLERMAVLARPMTGAQEGIITLMVDDVPLDIRAAAEMGKRTRKTTMIRVPGAPPEPNGFGVSPQQITPLDELQIQYAKWVVKQFDGNKTKAAKALGIQRATLYSWLEWNEK